MAGERLSKNLEIFWFEIPCVFRDFRKVWVDAPLSDFMADHRHASFIYVIPIVRGGLGSVGINPGLQALAPGLDSRIRSHVKLVLGQLRPAGSACIKPARV